MNTFAVDIHSRLLPQVNSAESRDLRSKDKAVAKEFEAVVLTTMIESMLPKDAEQVFGSGTAGSVWRSMMADKIAQQLAGRDILGLGDILERQIDQLRGGSAVTVDSKIEE